MARRGVLIAIGLACLAAGWTMFSGHFDSSQFNELSRQFNDAMVRRRIVNNGGYQVNVKSILMCFCWIGGLIMIALGIGQNSRRAGKTCVVAAILLLFLAAGFMGMALQCQERGGAPVPGQPEWMQQVAADGNGMAAVCACFAGLCFLRLLILNKRACLDGAADVLLWWTERDPFTVKDLLSGGVAIFGRTGSGKSSASGLQIALGLARQKTGGCILGSKPEDRKFWTRVFARAGRSRDLLVFGPGEPLRFNLLDFEMASGADTRELTECLVTVGEVLRRGKKDSGGSEGLFWQQQKERTLYNAIEICRKGIGRIEIPLLQRFIVEAATSKDQLTDTAWRNGSFHNQVMRKAYHARKTAVEAGDYEQAADFWTKEWPYMDDKLRGSILAEVLGILHVFNTGMTRELLCTSTSVSPAVMDKGKWVFIDMPVPQHGAGGAFCLASWKYATQRYVLRRSGQNAVPIILWSDEYQNVSNSFDSTFAAEARSHKGAMVILTQSAHSLLGVMDGHAGEHHVKAQLSNFSTKIFHALGDRESAALASSLVGRSLQTFTGASMAPPADIWDSLAGPSRFSASFSQHFEQILQDNDFMHGLRTGGPPDYVADAWVIRSGMPFRDGENFVRVAFSQKG